MSLAPRLIVGLCVPTRNPGPDAARQVAALKRQSLHPDQLLVIDSASTDGSLQPYVDAGARLHIIDPSDFNHGATRQLGIDLLGTDIVVFLTQDAELAEPESLQRLVACFTNPEIEAAYGRQLPRLGAGAIEAHARLFNYPAKGQERSIRDRTELGIKTVFISNSFAAYRCSGLMEVGGFPPGLIMGEDTYVAARMLLAGKKVTYCADATVFHSHNYGWTEEFRRYFDTGVLHAREPWIRAAFGGPGGEGWRFLRSELQFLLRRNPWLLPSAIVRTALKLAGFRLGLQERWLPRRVKRRLSMFQPFWNK